MSDNEEKMEACQDGDDKQQQTDDKSIQNVEDEPFLRRAVHNYARIDAFKLKTVMVEPFSPELLHDGCLQSWLTEAVEFDIRKDESERSIAVFVFKTEEIGEAAFVDLKQTIQTQHPEVIVKHAHTPLASVSTCQDVIQYIFKESAPKEPRPPPYARTLLLEDMPDSVQLDKILEIFPDAKNILDFRDDPVSRGIVTFEVPTIDRLTQSLESAQDFKLDDCQIRLSRYATRENKWKKQEDKKAKKNKLTRNKEFPLLSDEERITMCKIYKELRDDAKAVFERTDISGKEKLAESMRINRDLTKPYHDRLGHDTTLRLKRGDKHMPETDDLIVGIIETHIAKDKKTKVAHVSKSLTNANESVAKGELHLFGSQATKRKATQQQTTKETTQNKKAAQSLLDKAKKTTAANKFNSGGTRGRGQFSQGGGGRGGGGQFSQGGVARDTGSMFSQSGWGRGRGSLFSQGGGARDRGSLFSQGGGGMFNSGGGDAGGMMFSSAGRDCDSWSGSLLGRSPFDGNRSGRSGLDNQFPLSDFTPLPKRMRGLGEDLEAFGLRQQHVPGLMDSYTASDAHQFQAEQRSFGGRSRQFMDRPNTTGHTGGCARFTDRSSMVSPRPHGQHYATEQRNVGDFGENGMIMEANIGASVDALNERLRRLEAMQGRF